MFEVERRMIAQNYGLDEPEKMSPCPNCSDDFPSVLARFRPIFFIILVHFWDIFRESAGHV